MSLVFPVGNFNPQGWLECARAASFAPLPQECCLRNASRINAAGCFPCGCVSNFLSPASPLPSVRSFSRPLHHVLVVLQSVDNTCWVMHRLVLRALPPKAPSSRIAGTLLVAECFQNALLATIGSTHVAHDTAPATYSAACSMCRGPIVERFACCWSIHSHAWCRGAVAGHVLPEQMLGPR